MSARGAIQRVRSVLMLAGLSLLCLSPLSHAADQPWQTIQLGSTDPYAFGVFSNVDVQHPPATLQRAVILIHGIKRNADVYYKAGTQLLKNAGLNAENTLFFAPNFLTDEDSRSSRDMPLWPASKWMHGTDSEYGRKGILAFQVLDDMVAYLSDRQRFPAMREIVFMGHSAGGQLMQRYSVLGSGDRLLQDRGVSIRYVVSSPSSYVYFDENRLQGDTFAPVLTVMCPSYNHYRYSLDKAPAYFTAQKLSVEQTFRRYAARNVTYMVGEHDNNPKAGVMDRSCGAATQGDSRVRRQLNYMKYEQFLAARWQVAINHRQLQVRGVGHDAFTLYAKPQVAAALFPAH